MQALRLSGVKLDQRAATERHCVHRLRCRRVGRHQISFEPGLRSDSRLCEARTTNTAKREDCGYDLETWQYLPNKRNKRSETQEFPGFVRGLAEGVVSKLQFATLPTTSLQSPPPSWPKLSNRETTQ